MAATWAAKAGPAEHDDNQSGGIEITSIPPLLCQDGATRSDGAAYNLLSNTQYLTPNTQ